MLTGWRREPVLPSKMPQSGPAAKAGEEESRTERARTGGTECCIKSLLGSFLTSFLKLNVDTSVESGESNVSCSCRALEEEEREEESGVG